jgi:hypothetical protein
MVANPRSPYKFFRHSNDSCTPELLVLMSVVETYVEPSQQYSSSVTNTFARATLVMACQSDDIDYFRPIS